MTIIVTGGAGFIGSNFVHHMVNKYPDYEIINLDLLTYAGNLENLKPVENKPNYRFVKGDIADRKFIFDLFEKEKPDVVVNFAAESHVDRSITDPEAFVRTQLARGKTLGIGIQKWKQGIGYSAVLCFLLILTAVYGTYRYEQAQLLRYEYVLTGAGIFALLLLMKQFMGFMNKEDMILDGLLDYMENTLPARKPVPDEQALKEQTREELIDKVTEGIRQTAASETKFSHMLTPEEEHIMREVIREYLI